MPILAVVIAGALVVLLIIIWVVRRRQRVQAEHERWMRAIDLAVGKALHDAGIAVGVKLAGQPVEAVWHRQVMLAHYELPIGTQNTEQQVRAAFGNVALSQLALTDVWVQAENQHVNFDVAYLVNDATKAYVADLERVE